MKKEKLWVMTTPSLDCDYGSYTKAQRQAFDLARTKILAIGGRLMLKGTVLFKSYSKEELDAEYKQVKVVLKQLEKTTGLAMLEGFNEPEEAWWIEKSLEQILRLALKRHLYQMVKLRKPWCGIYGYHIIDHDNRLIQERPMSLNELEHWVSKNAK